MDSSELSASTGDETKMFRNLSSRIGRGFEFQISRTDRDWFQRRQDIGEIQLAPHGTRVIPGSSNRGIYWRGALGVPRRGRGDGGDRGG